MSVAGNRVFASQVAPGNASSNEALPSGARFQSRREAPQLVGLHDAGLHELGTQSMQPQHDLLRFGFDWHEANAGLVVRRMLPSRPAQLHG